MLFRSLRYSDSICADAGIVADFFAPDIGPVSRSETSFAGPVSYELVYARVNGFIALTQPETGFSLSTPSPIGENGRIFARMTIRNGGTDPLMLRFNSGQTFNLELTTEAGQPVYNWASDKAFIQVIQDVSIAREKNFVVEFAVPGGLKAGRYLLEAYLTTAPPQGFRAKVLLDVVK